MSIGHPLAAHFATSTSMFSVRLVWATFPVGSDIGVTFVMVRDDADH
jgi:hypothetical protein